MAMLWLYLTVPPSVHVAVRRVWDQMLVLRRSPARFVITSLKSSRNNWPPPSTGYAKIFRRKLTLPPMEIPLDVTVLGKVESKGDTGSDRGETPSKKSSHKSLSKKQPGKSTDFQAELMRRWMRSGQNVFLDWKPCSWPRALQCLLNR